MKNYRYIMAAAIIIAVLGMASMLSAGDISINVFPSEEELLEAYRQGLIEWETYLNLSELNEYGIDTTTLYLIEEIPNLHYLADSLADEYSDFERIQLRPFLYRDTLPPSKKTIGFFRWRGYKKLDELGRSKNYLLLETSLGEEWITDIGIQEDYSGRERVTRRTFIYRGKYGPVRQMVLGNFTARFGLGLTIGYRGKLLDKENQTAEKTIAFPDYGGFNGIYIDGGRPGEGIRFLAHYDRDKNHSIKMAAINLIKEQYSWRWEFTGLGAFLDNLDDGSKFRHYQFSAYARYSHPSFYAAMEVAHARDASNIIPAALFETVYRRKAIRLELSGWRYSQDFINLTGGARAGLMYRTIEIDTIDFDFRDRRVDQKGILFKSRAALSESVSGRASFTIYGRDRFERNIRLLLSPEITVRPGHRVRVDYRLDFRERPDRLDSENEIRLEYRLRVSWLSVRSYVGFVDDDNGREYISVFNSTGIKLEKYGNWEIWLNLDKFNIGTGQNDYFYSYLRERFRLSSYLELAAKYSYRYSRSVTDREESTFMLELKAIW